jgi:hypothetical protein
MFKPGSKVQAIDEIGRWEMARILQVFPDMPDAMVMDQQLVLQGAIFRMGQVGWRGENTSSSEDTSSWWLLKAYIQPVANTHTQITSRGRGKAMDCKANILS